MKAYLWYLIVLMSAIILASPALGVLTYYGGFDSSGAAGDAEAQGGAYYDIYDTPNEWNAEYGIDASAHSWGIGTAGSYTSHALETPVLTPTVGGTGYEAVLAYGGTVQAFVSQNTGAGEANAYANIYSYVDIDNDGMGTENMYGSAEIYSDASLSEDCWWPFRGTNGEASASASGVAGYNARVCPTCAKGAEQIWGAVAGEATSKAIAEGYCPDCDDDGYTTSAGEAYTNSSIYTNSETGQYNGQPMTRIISIPHSEYANSYSDMYSYGWMNVKDGDHVLAESTTSGLAMSGAWDPSTSKGFTKVQGNNENAYSSVSGDTSSFVEGFLKDDYAESWANLSSYADSYYNITGYRYLWADADFYTNASVDRTAAYVKSNPQRITATGYITDAAYDAVARQSGITAESSADKVNVASGAHVLNRGSFYSTVNPYNNSAEYDGGDIEAWTDIYNEQVGPKFILSATMLDDSGSYIRLENLDNRVTIGTTEVGLNIDDIDFMNWIEGSSLVDNMYPVSQDWTTTFSTVPAALYIEDYDRYFDNSDMYTRYSSSEIEADIRT